VTLARRLLPAAGGGGGFAVPNFTVAGPYAQDDAHAALVQTQVHCHTTGSDGTYTPASVVASYLAAGYGALVITDHDVVTSQPAGITTSMPGNEHTATQQHIIAIDSDHDSGSETDAQTIVDDIVADGGLAEVAHPLWGAGMSFAELDALTDYSGFEIHNSHVIGGAGGFDVVDFPGYAISLWDQLLQSGRRDIWGFSVDDLHVVDSFRAYDVGRLKVWVASNTAANVKAAIAAGNFVADVSNYGVTPGFPYRTPSGLAVACSGATRIEAWGTGGLLSSSTGETHAHTFDGTEEYVRLVAYGAYAETFDAALSDRWVALDGTWNVTGGALVVSSDVTARRQILRRHRESDFTAEMDVEVSSGGTDAIALLFNVLDTNHYYMLRIGESTVSGYNNQLAVAVTTTNAFANDSQLDNAAFDPTPGTLYTMKMAYTASTGRIRGKVWETGDTEPDWMVDVTDTTWTHGGFGIRANRSCETHRLLIDGFQTFYQPVAVD
jgi:hypothetical protein